ncbi:MAG: type II and III secretion system protein family protein [Blastocatellia bacterium]
MRKPFALLQFSPRLLALAFTCWFAVTALAQENASTYSFSNTSKTSTPVGLLTGQSRLLIFNEDYERIAIPNQDVAEAVPVAANQILLTGKAPGESTLVVWSKNNARFLFFDVSVRVNLSQLDAQIRALFPQEEIQLSQANGAVVLSGKVKAAQTIQKADTVTQSFGFKTVNLLTAPVPNEAQVQLQVRVAEVSRNKMRELAATPAYQSRPGNGAYSNTGTGPWTLNSVNEGAMFGSVASTLNLFLMNSNAFLFIRALQSQGALRALAEPNLVAMNGQQASFLAGGEIPIPVFQNASGGGNGGISVTYKDYGVRVNFKPTILDEEHIRLELEPEVSTLDYANAVRFSGFSIPALRTRRAKTGIELRDGQSFALAGLLDNNETRSLSKLPYLGDIPVIGSLFTSKQFQKQETELVFFVTATITRPVTPDATPQMRGLDGLKNSLPLSDAAPDEEKKKVSSRSKTVTSPNRNRPP